MNRVYIKNEQSAVPVDMKLRGLIRRSIGAALGYMKFGSDAEISVTLTDNGGIHVLNREYRGVDRPTDVLSFPLSDEDGVEEDGDGVCILGDIVLSLEKCKAQAEEYGHGFLREVSFLTVHSVLHLLGYDHETSEEDEKEMFALQDAIMEKIKTGD